MADDDPNTPENTPENKAPENTPEPKTFDETYVKSLRSESAGHRTRAVSAEKERDEWKSKFEEIEQKSSGSEGRALSAETLVLKFRVAAEKGVPLRQAERLNGSTREEIEADAVEFLKDFQPNTPTDFDQGNKNKPPVEEVSPSEALRRLARK